MTEAGWTRKKAEKLCEAWFDTGARASWCPKMVDEFAAALADSYQQGRVAGLAKAVEIIKANTDVKKAIEIIRLHSLAQQAQKEKGVGE